MLACIAATAVVTVAHRRDMLDRPAAIVAALIGIALVCVGGWWAGTLLVVFFLTSSLLSLRSTGRRTWRQVLANGGPALAFAAVALLTQQPAVALGTAATLASATADTWATEIGRRSGATPRSLRTLQPVRAGASGAVSVPGTVATVAGAVVIAIVAVALAPISVVDLPGRWTTLVVVTAAGTLGSLLDSALGAVAQTRYRCERCDIVSEDPSDPVHRFRRISGVPGLTNGAVNLVCTVTAGLVATALLTATMEA